MRLKNIYVEKSELLAYLNFCACKKKKKKREKKKEKRLYNKNVGPTNPLNQ